MSRSNCSLRCIFDWGQHPLMQERSLLRHTGIDNTLGPLFSREGELRAILTGTAADGEHRDTRFCIAQWPRVRDATLDNLAAIAEEYSPFREALDALADVIGADGVRGHVERMRRLLGIDAFVTAVRNRIAAFDAGLRDVAEGTLSIECLAALHVALVEAYSSYRIFPNRRAM